MDYWRVLNYEIQMYFGARHLQGYSLEGADRNILTIQTSALTEVRALHVRILVEVFLKRPFPDDINIDDLLPDWRETNAAVAKNLATAYDTNLETGESPRWYLNKYLAHPDRKRGDHFDWAPTIRRMDTPLKDVFKTLPMERLDALRYFQKYLSV